MPTASFAGILVVSFMKNGGLLSIFILLLIAAALPSCKSPTGTTQPSAFTLILPDSTVAWGDSAMMRVIPSMPLSSSSAFTWSFGDSTTLLLRSDTLIHYYPTPGTFTVKVDLNDTLSHTKLGTQSGTVNVAARHFNLALLQSMPYVDVSWQARGYDSIIGIGCNIGGPMFSGVNPLLWNDTAFTMAAQYQFGQASDTSQPIDTGAGNISIAGGIDNGLSQLVNFSEDSFYFWESVPVAHMPWCEGTYNSSFRISSVPFISESDSDMVFEARGKFLENVSDNSKLSYFYGYPSVSSYADFTDAIANPYVRIRFHK